MIDIEENEIPEEEASRINKVRNMTDEEFYSIRPVWETNPSKMQMPIVNGAEGCSRFIIECDTERVIELADNLHGCVFTKGMDNDWWEDDKFATTLLRWKDGLGVDPSMINIVRGKVVFSDGRHRAVLANYLKQNRMLVSIHENSVKSAINLLHGRVFKQKL